MNVSEVVDNKVKNFKILTLNPDTNWSLRLQDSKFGQNSCEKKNK